MELLLGAIFLRICAEDLTKLPRRLSILFMTIIAGGGLALIALAATGNDHWFWYAEGALFASIGITDLRRSRTRKLPSS